MVEGRYKPMLRTTALAMVPDRRTALVLGLLRGQPRHVRGTRPSTRQLLGVTPDVRPRTLTFDVSCGTGARTMVLGDIPVAQPNVGLSPPQGRCRRVASHGPRGALIGADSSSILGIRSEATSGLPDVGDTQHRAMVIWSGREGDGP